MSEVIKMRISPMAAAVAEIKKADDMFYFDAMKRFSSIFDEQQKTFLKSAELLESVNLMDKNSILELSAAFISYAEGSAVASEGIKYIADKFRSSKGLEELTKSVYSDSYSGGING